MSDPAVAPGVAPLPIPSSLNNAFPEGLEHLDPTRQQHGFRDMGEYALYMEKIVKSENDRNEYTLIRLKNGMECMLVQDPTAEQPAASMSVRVGHLKDPEDLPGLAHFLEHLLFQGTAKYPSENEYNAHLSSHGGWSNAFTSTDETRYFFQVGEAGYEGALDRFAQFFCHPLFKADCVEREIKAVDSEHQKNISDDGWRVMQLGRSLSREGHPNKKFGTGNIDTLWHGPKARGVNIRDELIKFYEQHYSANVMKLAIVSKEPLEMSIGRAVQLFSEVSNRNLQPTVFPSDTYDSSRFMTQTVVKTFKDDKSLEIEFPFYDQARLTGTKPGQLLAHVIGHEGKTSLYNFLQKKGHVSYLGSGPVNAAPGIDSFSIYCALTNEGLKQYRLVAATIFEYIDMLRKKPLPKHIFEEMKQSSARAFRYKSSEDAVNVAMRLSGNMQLPWPRSQLLSAVYTMTDFDPVEVKKALSYLSMEVCQVWITSTEALPGLEWKEKERWYGTEYVVKPLTKEWFKTDDTTDKFSYPEPNPYLPSNLDLIGNRDVKEPLKRPLCIKDTKGIRVWYKQDDRWKVPKASLLFSLSNPFIRSSLKHRTLCRFYVSLVNEALEAETYDAGTAGLGYGFSKGLESLQLKVTGYNDKLLVLLYKVVKAMKETKIDAARLALKKEAFLEAINNGVHLSPIKQINAEWAWLTSQHGHSRSQERAAIEAVTAEAVQAFIPDLLSKFYVECLGHGNIDKTTLYEAVNVFEETLGYDRLPRDCLHVARSRHLPEGMNEVYKMPASSKEEVNNGINYILHFGHPSDDVLRARLTLLATILHEPCFDILRTQEQLGYIVGANYMQGTSYMSLKIVIQSAHSPDHLEKRINAFLESFVQILQEMDVEKPKNAMIAQYLEDYKSQGEETQFYWGQILGQYNFFHAERTAALLKAITKRDIIDTFMTYVHPKGSKRSKLSIQLYSQQVDTKPITEMLEKHGIKHEIKAKLTVEDLQKSVEQVGKDLPFSAGLEVMRKVESLDVLDGISASELKKLLPLGEPRKPVAEYYDGITTKL